ncbi:MAG: universal stress protein [Cyanobacteria bacterium J06641_5]
MTTQQTAPRGCDVSLATNYHKILVALDRTEDAAEIFASALSLSRTHNSNLRAFHCIPYLPSSPDLLAAGTGLGIYAPEVSNLSDTIAQATLDEVTSWLQDCQQRAGDCAVSCAFEQRVGDPGREICAAAQRWGADLIVIGRRGRAGLSEILLGSVSNYVMHHASCDVLIVQGH